jgi:hypothetical protein
VDRRTLSELIRFGTAWLEAATESVTRVNLVNAVIRTTQQIAGPWDRLGELV